MKKVLFLLVVLFASMSMKAQTEVVVGPKVGYQASRLSFVKSDVKSSFNNNLNIGLFTRFSFKKFVVQPELLYLFQDSKIKSNNLSLPILFGYKLHDDKNIKVRANIGPVAYFTVGNAGGANRFNLGGALGLGADVWRFTVDINYGIGFTNFDTVRRNMFVVTLGFKLKY